MAQSKNETGTTEAIQLSETDRARLAMSQGRKKLDFLLGSSNPRAFIQAFPAEDLFFAIQEIGPHDSAELVALASPEQFQTFLDLDVWQDYLPSVERVLSWLELVHEGSMSPDDLRKQRKGMDPELILIVLKDRTTIHPLEEGEDPVLTSDNWIRTAEGKYLVEIHAEGDEGAILRRLIDDFIDENPFEATRFFEAVRWEQRSELEETALRWRSGRMRDIGFPDLEEAIRIWAPLPANWKPREAAIDFGSVSSIPGLLLAGSPGERFFDRVLNSVDESRRPQINEALMFLLNCALVADGTSPTDLDLAQNTLRSTRDLLSLGLELLAEGSEERGRQILEANMPVDIFRYAVTQMTLLARQAAPLAESLRFGSGKLIGLDSPEGELLTALLRKRPRFFDPEEVKTRNGKPSSGLRAPQRPEDLQVLEKVVAFAGLILSMLRKLRVDKNRVEIIADQAGRALTAISANQIILSAALRALIAHGKGATLPAESLAAPLSPEEFDALAERMKSGALQSSDQEELEAILQQLAADSSEKERSELRIFYSRSLEALNDELGRPAQSGNLDPRYVECVLISSVDDGLEASLPEQENTQDETES